MMSLVIDPQGAEHMALSAELPTYVLSINARSTYFLYEGHSRCPIGVGNRLPSYAHHLGRPTSPVRGIVSALRTLNTIHQIFLSSSPRICLNLQHLLLALIPSSVPTYTFLQYNHLVMTRWILLALQLALSLSQELP